MGLLSVVRLAVPTCSTALRRQSTLKRVVVRRMAEMRRATLARFNPGLANLHTPALLPVTAIIALSLALALD